MADPEAARAQLRSSEASRSQVPDQGAPRPYRAGASLDKAGFVFFEDPDGNGWPIQQMPGRN